MCSFHYSFIVLVLLLWSLPCCCRCCCCSSDCSCCCCRYYCCFYFFSTNAFVVGKIFQFYWCLWYYCIWIYNSKVKANLPADDGDDEMMLMILRLSHLPDRTKEDNTIVWQSVAIQDFYSRSTTTRRLPWFSNCSLGSCGTQY